MQKNVLEQNGERRMSVLKLLHNSMAEATINSVISFSVETIVVAEIWVSRYLHIHRNKKRKIILVVTNIKACLLTRQ